MCYLQLLQPDWTKTDPDWHTRTWTNTQTSTGRSTGCQSRRRRHDWTCARGLKDIPTGIGEPAADKPGYTQASYLQKAPTCQPWNILIIWRPITLEPGRAEQKLTLHFPSTHRWPCRLDLHYLSSLYLSSQLTLFPSDMGEKAKKYGVWQGFKERV